MMKAGKTRLAILIILSSVIGLALIIFAWVMLKPIQVTYRDSIDTAIGSSKTVIVTIEKAGTLFTFNDVHFSFGLLQDGKPQALPDYLSANETGSSPLLPPGGKNQITYIQISTSSTISPGEYQVYIQPQIAGIHFKRLPITITVKESGDDIVNTANGPVYRASLPDNNQWEPVKEKTAQLGIQPVFLTYRDEINIQAGGYKAVLLNLDVKGTDLEGKRISYQVGVLENNNLEILPSYLLQAEEVKLENNREPSISAIAFKSLTTWGGSTLNLGIQITAEGTGVIGVVPITMNVLASNDDLFPTPAGIYTYRANITGIDNGHGPDGKPWLPIYEKTVRIPR